MSRSLALSFQSASAKYSRLHKKIKKSIARGEFYRYTTRKRNHLLARIEKLRKRLAELSTQIRLAGVGMAAAAIFSATTADAQIPIPGGGPGTKIGPFIQNDLKNPLPGPAFPASYYTAFTEAQYHDFDKDGDLDAIVSFNYRTRVYYKNIGTKTDAKFEQMEIGEIFQSSLPGPNYSDNAAHQAYADLDDDGDLDAIAAVSMTYTNPSDDKIFFLKNEPQENGDPYFLEPPIDDSQNPVLGITIRGGGWPTLADVDKDGDYDLILAGYYYDEVNAQAAYVQYFRNDKVGHAPGVLPTFTPVIAPNNPFYVGGYYNYVAVNFADLDEDGDQDFIYTTSNGPTSYRRNDNGTFNEQEGQWQPGGPVTVGNPFNSILGQIATSNEYKAITFGDLDGDGDLDATVGLAYPLNISPSAVYPYRYLENKGKGVFEFPEVENDPISGHTFGGYLNSTMFDHDGDGHLDIIALAVSFKGTNCEGSYCEQQYYVSEKIFLYENGKYSQDAIEVELPEGVYGNDNYVQLIDVEGDGDLDIVSSVYTDGPSGTYYWRNDDGDYTQLTGEDNPFDFVNMVDLSQPRPVVADLDGDGLNDLVLTNRYNGPYFYKNTGTKEAPIFTYQDEWTQPNIENSLYSTAIPTIVDMDADGDYDLIVSKYSGGDVWYYQNQGTREEPTFVLYTMGQVDKDQQPVNPEYWENNPFAFFEGGSGNFNLADIDGDGDKDVLFGDSYYGTFRLYENQNPVPDLEVGSPQTLTFVLNQALPIVTDIAIDDADNDAIVRVIAKISPYKAGTEKLELVAAVALDTTFIANWNDEIGTLTINAINPDQEIEADVWADAIKGIRYTFSGEVATAGKQSNPKDKSNGGKTVSKSIAITVLDSDLTSGTGNTATFNVSGDDGINPNPGNEAPVITPPRKTAASGGNIAFYISQIAKDLDGEIELSSAIVTSQKGVVEIGSDGDLVTIDYSQDKTFQGVDQIYVSVCDNLGACSSSDFDVEVKADVFVYTGMSPNNDLVNDWFQIDFLPEGTHVTIYNRWGDLIYEENNYNVDDPARRFEGKNKNGTEVIAGTYYYKVKYPGGSAKTGYILLNR